MSNEQQAHIYTLLDPRTNQVRYVGCTVKPEQRRKVHLSPWGKGNKGYTNWKRELVAVDLLPTFKVVDVCGIARSVQLEADWIAALDNGQLLNARKGPFNPHLAQRLQDIDWEWQHRR